MSAQANAPGGAATEAVGLDTLLVEISRESSNLAEQCGQIQWPISAILDIVDHPDLGAEIHMLQDIDRIQQTLADIAAILLLTGDNTNGASILRDAIGAAVRLESLRQRLGLSEHLSGDTAAADISDITWL